MKFALWLVVNAVALGAAVWLLDGITLTAGTTGDRVGTLLVVGAIFGVITSVTVLVRPVPEEKVYEGWRWPTFADGVAAVRAIAQSGLQPTVLRLSDEAESAVNLADPSAIGKKSLSHSAWSAWTAVGRTSSAASASEKLIIASIAIPVAMIAPPVSTRAERRPFAPSAA